MNNPSLILTDSFSPVVDTEARRIAYLRAGEARRHALLLRGWAKVLSEEGRRKLESMALEWEIKADHYERLLCQA